MGSPLAVFLALRGVRPGCCRTQNHILPRSICNRLFNIFHPTDPVVRTHTQTLNPHFLLFDIVMYRDTIVIIGVGPQTFSLTVDYYSSYLDPGDCCSGLLIVYFGLLLLCCRRTDWSLCSWNTTVTSLLFRYTGKDSGLAIGHWETAYTLIRSSSHHNWLNISVN